MAKRWSKTELAYLKKNAGKQSLDEMARRLHSDAAEIKAKLIALGLAGSVGGNDNKALAQFAAALKLLYKKQWAKAAEGFTAVIASAEDRQIIDRARQHLDICHRQAEDEAGDADPYLRAVYEKNQGNYDAAAKLLANVNDDERSAYLAASILALRGEEGEALERLAAAIDLEPKNRVHAYHDPDFAELRDHDEFQQLLAGA